jgi:carbamoyl-phosphate synthase large subunit
MASSSRLPRQLLLKARRAAIACPPQSTRYIQRSTRSFTSAQSGSIRPTVASTNPVQTAARQIRLISAVAPKLNATQEAPNTHAYMNSGAITGARDLVDVKKVLVIGSGGLAIGQAGEFDYSGMF